MSTLREEVLQMQQGEQSWLQLRQDTIRVSASNIALVLSGSRQRYLNEFRNRIMEGAEIPKVFGGNEATQWGHTHEHAAIEHTIAFLENTLFVNFDDVFQVGTIHEYDKDSVFSSCSPDALAICQGICCDEMPVCIGIEVKCPKNIKNIPQRVEDINIGYILQCIQNLHITKANWWHLSFYDPSCHKLKVFIVNRNQLLWELIQVETKKFMELVMSNTNYTEPFQESFRQHIKKLAFRSVYLFE